MDAEHDRGRQRLSLLVRNLSFRSSPDEVRAAFEEFGPIRDVYLPLDYHTGEPRGFGFVEFESSKDAYDAMHQLHNTLLNGSTIHVTIAKKGRSDPMQMRRRELRGDIDRDGRRRGNPRRQWDSSRSPPYSTRCPSSGGHRQKGDRNAVSRRGRRSWSRPRSRRDSSRSRSSRRCRTPPHRQSGRSLSPSRSRSCEQSGTRWKALKGS
ncbi:RNA recognition motif-containing protein [Toxoplasma gondii TgCatPRC2]|uniref:RNA recognition motif-containing protein n=15 Tax=Toxoplasma gondii TaxID=5811 RepID=A0A125YSQ0_TOXGV|nr:RNA recognition motif-containing protein [Toxoplasma gondii ME49]EPR64460.1 RNA recognition motif-containing protein [Toxoplasma gondii GT1]ESS35929.1 RNA recognition motif-containing protein [Toxoplasma gondii VEG]KAF4642114.1 RNA recognition motif-containing protein [Toxoplasma gondii]KFG43198.1 RNA recognition motif-containing protein [Toxoplasma gondii GAB2-2007-GAL-DOM2]KFG50284.1 RNA recognition motif-containing protein [Toxoplasma gondii FOU]KFG51810.1 RNA recognition motif-containi|eukprot:XP_018636697.1 RNA recognition motif-containing protein [Toxoplasma gondii ME49]